LIPGGLEVLSSAGRAVIMPPHEATDNYPLECVAEHKTSNARKPDLRSKSGNLTPYTADPEYGDLTECVCVVELMGASANKGQPIRKMSRPPLSL
jgi:hypothetical protein